MELQLCGAARRKSTSCGKGNWWHAIKRPKQFLELKNIISFLLYQEHTKSMPNFCPVMMFLTHTKPANICITLFASLQTTAYFFRWLSVQCKCTEVPPLFRTCWGWFWRWHSENDWNSFVMFVSPILSELIFAAVEETEDYWAFLKATQDDRQIEPDSVVGIILSALMSKLWLK